jgi:hypothetical protein
MVPGTAERDRFTSREQWIDWWRVVSPPTDRTLHHVNAGVLWRWLPAHLWRSGIGQQKTRARWGWVRQALSREVFTGY